MTHDPTSDSLTQCQGQAIPLWAYLPILSAQQEGALKAALDQSAPSTEVTLLEARKIVLAAKGAIHTLQCRSDDQWEWTATMSYRAWSPIERDRLTGHELPPLCYWVELTVKPRSLKLEEVTQQHADHSGKILRLSPVELRLITQLESDLGRRIGDELDGTLPRVP